jgi:seryl-tRNA synthetase
VTLPGYGCGMIEKSGDAAGAVRKPPPAVRISKLRSLVNRILLRAEAMRGEDATVADDERVLKLVSAAVKLETELAALRKSANAVGKKMSGAERKAHDDTLRQKLAERIQALEPAKKKAAARKPGKPRAASRAR